MLNNSKISLLLFYIQIEVQIKIIFASYKKYILKMEIFLLPLYLFTKNKIIYEVTTAIHSVMNKYM